jgi:glycosyltransferase involved in cell wall biosynthesis
MAPRGLRIVHVSPLYGLAEGGAEVHMKALSEGLAARGHRVTVVTSRCHEGFPRWTNAPDLPPVEQINGVTVVRLEPDGGWLGRGFARWQQVRGGFRTSRAAFGEDGLEWLGQKPSMFQLIPLVARATVDVVATMGWLFPPAYYAHLARCVRPFTLVGFPLFHTASKWCQRSIYERMLARCDAVVANTSHEGEFARERGARHVVVGGVGVYPDRFAVRDGAGVRARHGLTGVPVVGFVGRQAENKGVVALIQAMRTVWQWNPEVRLVLAGFVPSGPPERDRAIDALSDQERRRIVRIDRFDESEKASIYDALDIFVMPSTEESFGIAYLEAWMCRKPVIGARIGSTRCVIRDRVDGLLVDPADPADIGRSIIELASNAAGRQTLGRNGYEKTVDYHTWEKVTDRVEGLYLAMIRGRPPLHRTLLPR